MLEYIFIVVLAGLDVIIALMKKFAVSAAFFNFFRGVIETLKRLTVYLCTLLLVGMLSFSAMGCSSGDSPADQVYSPSDEVYSN